jgi:hypothetical protein
MPGTFKTTRIQGAANVAHHLMTHIGQVNLRKGHEAQGRAKASLFILGAKWEWVLNTTPRPLYPRERDPVFLVRETGCVPGLVWRENNASTRAR